MPATTPITKRTKISRAIAIIQNKLFSLAESDGVVIGNSVVVLRVDKIKINVYTKMHIPLLNDMPLSQQEQISLLSVGTYMYLHLD